MSQPSLRLIDCSRLAGISPFLGDNDHETLNNIVNGNYTLDVPELEGVSPEARDFIKRLLSLDPAYVS